MSDECIIKLPKLGESIVNATVVQWFKKEGDKVSLDEALVEVSTDKVNSEIPSPVIGVITKIHALPDQLVDVGAPLATVSTGTSSLDQKPLNDKAENKETETIQKPPNESLANQSFFTPVVRAIAKQQGLDLEDLKTIAGSGVGGRCSKKDLERYLSQKHTHTENRRIKISPLRKKIADAMVASYFTAPHATLFQEVDVTYLMKELKAVKASFLQEYGFKLTVTSYVIKAIAQGIKAFPMMNSSLKEDHIIVKNDANIGVAVSIENGIIVPVIHRCQNKSLKDIARDVHSLSAKSREGDLSPEDVQNGTLTMTNFGMSGVMMGTPIIRQPEVAILGVGSIKKCPVVDDNNAIAIRSIMYCSLSFDHRVIDGMYGCGFLSVIKEFLEQKEYSLEMI